MNYQPINFEEKFLKFTEQWQPRVIAEMNDYQFKLVKFEGEFVWHKHDKTDEVFIVIDGKMKILFRDAEVNISKGEMFVVKKGIEHKPVAKTECRVLLVEPRGTVNTGKTDCGLTADNDVWI